jgi:hypothetical protein
VIFLGDFLFVRIFQWAILYYWKRCSYLCSVKQVKPKTWRISAFADARMTPPVPNPRGNYTTGQTRSSDSDDNFTPLVFEKSLKHCWKFISKNTSRKNAQFLHGFMMPQFFIKKKHFFLPVRCIKCFICTK